MKTIVPAIMIGLVLLTMWRAVRTIPAGRAAVVERLGRYVRTLTPGVAFVVPFVDRVRPPISLVEQVVSFPPKPVFTRDDLVVGIETDVRFQVIDARAATYEIADQVSAIGQLTLTMLRDVVGAMTLEETLASRDRLNGQLRGLLDEATRKWGIRVNWFEIKSIGPPMSRQEALDMQTASNDSP